MLFENLKVIQDSGYYSGSGNSDGFQIQGIDGLTIKNCFIVRQNADNTPHCDGIQMFWCSNVTLENNQIYILPSGATTNKTALMFNNSGGVVKFINNYIYWAQALGAGGSLGMQFSDAVRMAAYPLDSLIIVNNTSVCLGGTPIGISNDLGLNYRGRAIVKNNILVGINARYDTLLLDYAHKTNITNNIYYNPAGGNMQISQGSSGYGTWGQTWQTWTANGYDVNSYQTNPELTGYIPASSSVIDGGVNLTGLGYTDDIAGNTRLGTWDIGAYEITQGGGGGNNPPTQPANPGPSNGAINQLTNTTLTWSCSDPNGDPLTYDVYFGTANNPPLVAGNQTSASYNPGQLNNSTTYYWKIVAKDNQGAMTAGPVWNFSTEVSGSGNSLTAEIKVFLEGPYTDNGMTTDLANSSLIPAAQPYNNQPWNYAGTESISEIPQNIVDWVLVELRSGTAASSIVGRRAAFVRNDGMIVDLNGESIISFSGIASGPYYVVIYHRNHLAIMTKNPILLSESASLYDFTISEDQAYGNQAMKSLGNGKFGLYAADGNSNGSVNNSDYNSVWKRENGSVGYDRGDFDLNGGVNIVDRNAKWKPNKGQNTCVPMN